MASRTSSVGALCLWLCLMSACGDDASVSSSPGGEQSSGSGEAVGDGSGDDATTESDGESEPDFDPGLKPLVEQARTDLAERLGVDSGEIRLASAELKVWPNTANGCPEPGMGYADVLTDGAEVIFSVDGTEYRYTMGGQQFVPVLCQH